MEEFKIGEVTYKNATKLTFTQKEILERHGISLVSNLTDTVLEILSDESDLIGAVFELSFSTYVVEEPTWMNTTQIKIIYSKPPCAMTQTDIDTLAANISPIQISAKKHLNKNTTDITEVVKSANTTFRIGEQTYCGEIDYKLVLDGDQPFLTLDKELK